MRAVDTPGQTRRNHPPAPPRRRLALMSLCLAGFLIQLDVTIVNVALPAIQHGLGAGPNALQWVIGGYALSLTVFIPLTGALGDRYGHRAILLAGLIVFGAASTVAALSPTTSALSVARIGQGVGGAAMLSLTLAVLTDIYPSEHRGHAIGWWAAIGGAGFGAGPIVGGLLLAVTGWSAIFWINVPLVCLTVVLIARTVPRGSIVTDRRPLDLLGLAIVSMSLGLVTFALNTAAGQNAGLLRIGAPLVAGLVGLIGFVFQQRIAREPLLPRRIRARRAFVGACAVYLLGYTGFSGALYYVTLLFQNADGWSALRTGLSWLLMNIPFLVVAQASGWIQRFVATRWIVVSAGLLAASGFALLAAAANNATFLGAAAGYLTAGAGFGLLVPAVTHVAMRDLPREIAGAASSVLNSSRQLGTAVGLAVIGVIGATATRSHWRAHTGDRRPDTISGVVSGRTTAAPAPLHESAAQAFAAGYHAALVACCACALTVSAVAWWAFRIPRRGPEVLGE
ncbi:MFS transporter [Tsukamurella sp. 8F]|uniref:MFS transporter n=1 Tax=unclassified Tsukamurella TaxID=2633480 RepID=UPI0023B9DF90|nr:MULTISPECIES: MFS transporter [unclassified Tsukamurella]MDF0531558.1 MFS transporter [Tsukamurella sp. 8J]MDF0588830.1 MFS transporter [Tsukamurella sp. 8F]